MSEISLPKEVIMEMGVEELDISERAVVVLGRYDVTKIGQLTQLAIEDLENMRNMGPWQAREVQKALAEVGLSLKE